MVVSPFPAHLLDAIATRSAEPDYGARASMAASDVLIAARAWTRRTGRASLVYAVRTEADSWGARAVTYVALAADAAAPIAPAGGRVDSYSRIDPTAERGNTLAA
jgi:hypothetical protein